MLTPIKELLLVIQSLLMHLVQHIIVIYFMLRLEFSQGGMEGEYYDVTNATAHREIHFPISFKTKAIGVVHQVRIKTYNGYISTCNIIDDESTNSKFGVSHQEIYGKEQKCKISYVAIGI